MDLERKWINHLTKNTVYINLATHKVPHVTLVFSLFSITDLLECLNLYSYVDNNIFKMQIQLP